MPDNWPNPGSLTPDDESERTAATIETEEQLDLVFAGLAQGVVNIDSGLTKIEPTSRVHNAMRLLCALRRSGKLVLATLVALVLFACGEDEHLPYCTTDLGCPPTTYCEFPSTCTCGGIECDPTPTCAEAQCAPRDCDDGLCRCTVLGRTIACRSE